ncbi:MAG: hypothetical protein WCT53_02880 [Candidatus Gracilibacteria bacterium]
MLNIKFSPHPKDFLNEFGKLNVRFEEFRGEVLKMPFVDLPWQSVDFLKNIKAKSFKNVVVVGMGGSSLGSKAAAQALGNKKLLFLDNIDPDFVKEKLAAINLKKSLFVLTSKSGETIEALTLSKILFAKIKSAKNFIAISDNPTGELAKFAQKNKIPIINSPKEISGRFSVLSVVGLLPLALCGVDVAKILKGAQKTSWAAAFKLAIYQYLHFKGGKNISVIFPYCEALEHFSDWWIQLVAESLGKTKKIGITPTKAMGVKDQHSQLQLFLDGPDDKFFLSIKTDNTKFDEKIATESYTLKDLFDAEYEGVRRAFLKNKKPFAEILFDQLSPEVLGELFFLFELKIAFLGQLFQINAFNQPAVELSKKITKSLLK